MAREEILLRKKKKANEVKGELLMNGGKGYIGALWAFLFLQLFCKF